MGVKKFFHKIKIGFDRWCEAPLPRVPDEKIYGNEGEDEVIKRIRKQLSGCQIKRNIIIQTPDGNAEIDCIVLYENKLFAIEIKHWKGKITNIQNDFYQDKEDRWTGEIHTQKMKSPFSQIRRAIHCLKEGLSNNVWINEVVFFVEPDEINLDLEDVWFCDIEELILYMQHQGKASCAGDVSMAFEACRSADCISTKDGKSVQCIISDNSLNFWTIRGEIKRKDIIGIKIEHHWTYDILYIKTHDNSIIKFFNNENFKITVKDNGHICKYALCEIDYISVGQ